MSRNATIDFFYFGVTMTMQLKHRLIALALISQALAAHSAHATQPDAPSSGSGNSCTDTFGQSQKPALIPSTIKKSAAPAAQIRATPLMLKYANQEDAWNVAAKSYRQLLGDAGRMTYIVRLLSLAAFTGEFAWLQGPPGGAKTAVSRKVFKSILLSVPDTQKRIFLIQFHKMMNEGKIIGFQDVKAMMKGEFRLETQSSLVDNKYLMAIFDEAEKANPAVLNSLLSVLNERKAFHGSRVVEAMLRTGVFTSNKTMPEFINSFGTDRATGEALSGRMGLKGVVPNQTLNSQDQMNLYIQTKSNDFGEPKELPLFDLESLLKKVTFSDDLVRALTFVIGRFDSEMTARMDERDRELRSGDSSTLNKTNIYPANDFSNRSIKRLLKIMAGSFILEQLEKGVDFKSLSLSMTTRDLHHIAVGSLYVSPSTITHESYEMALSEETFTVAGKIQKVSGIMVNDENGLQLVAPAQYNPWNNEITIRYLGKNYTFRKDTSGKWYSIDPSHVEIDSAEFAKIQSFASKLISEQAVDLKKPKYKVSSDLAQLIENGIWSPSQLIELQQILEETESLVAILNEPEASLQQEVPSQLASPTRDWKNAALQLKEQIKLVRREEPILPTSKFEDASTQKRLSVFWQANQNALQELNKKFPELEHYTLAIMTSILSNSHAYIFGPPGGAKTLLADTILKAELRSLRPHEVDKMMGELVKGIGTKDPKWLTQVLKRFESEAPKVFKQFFLQFHKMMPEGVIVGFPKLRDQLKGQENIDFKDSLSSSEFIFAILDEVDKANPATLTSLLSVLNEREVFAGASVVKVALRTAVVTSNKLPSETLDSFYEDRSAGEALMDRLINKVFVMNKFSTSEKTSDYIKMIANREGVTLHSPLSLEEMRPLVNAVRQEMISEENRWLIAVMGDIQKSYLKGRRDDLQKIREANLLDNENNPFYHVLAASPSDRTFNALVDQFPAIFVLRQLADGVAFKDVRTRPELRDLVSFFNGLGYWVPGEIRYSYDENGLLQFTATESALSRFANASNVNARVRFAAEQMKADLDAFVAAANSSISKLLQDNMEFIRNNPNLFPSLLDPNKSSLK